MLVTSSVTVAGLAVVLETSDFNILVKVEAFVVSLLLIVDVTACVELELVTLETTVSLAP